MDSEQDIWDRRGTLTRTHDQIGSAVVPPLPEERVEPRPLREILGAFQSASPVEREHFTLILENGEAFSADDISQLLAPADSPF
jgi:hypothetical protein